MKIVVVVIVLFMLSRNNVTACDYCFSSQGISSVAVGSSGVRYDFRYLHLGKMFSDGEEIVNPTNSQETYITHQLSFYYHLGGKYSVSLYLPFTYRTQLGSGGNGGQQQTTTVISGQMPQHHPSKSISTDHVGGLSDISLYGRYMIVAEKESSLFMSINAGIKLPTGATTTRSENGEIRHPHMQPGTGSIDPLLGVDVFYGGDDYSLSCNLTGTYPTIGAQEYQFGAMLNYSVSGKYNILTFGTMNSLIIAAGVSGELHAQEHMNGKPLENTGGNTTYIFPGIQLLIGDLFTFDLSYHIPILQQPEGMQLVETSKATAGVQYLF